MGWVATIITERLNTQLYEEHPLFVPAPNEAILWRYLDLAKFIAMLDKRALFFARADKLGDPFEGSYSRMNQTLRPIMYQGQITEQNLNSISASLREMRRFTLINCWHENETESEAMWRLYSREQDGVAIRTTFENFKDSLVCSDNVYIGRISYVDYNTHFIREDNFLGPYLNKRKSFQHESEVRAVMVKWPPGNEPINMRPDVCNVGINVDVNLDSLIQEIVVDARANDWILEVVQSLVAKYELDAAVTRSELANEPYW